MISLFKENSSPAVFGLIVASLALHAFFIITPPQVITSADEGVLHYALQPLSAVPSIFLSVIYHVIVLVQALRLNNVLNEFRMYQRQTYTAAIAYIILTALLPAFSNITTALIANSFIIWMFFRMVKLYNTPAPKGMVYNLGLLTGCMVLLYYPAIGIVPVMFFALAVTRPFRLTEWFILLLGIITPAYFWCGYLFLTNQLDSLKGLAAIFQIHKIIEPDLKHIALALGVAGLLLIAGIFSWRAHNNRMVIQVRKIWGVLFMMLLFLPPVVFLLKAAWPSALLLTCVPAAAFIANAFLYPKKIISALFFWLIVAAVVYVNWV